MPLELDEATRTAFAACDMVTFDMDGTLLASHEYAPAAAVESFRELMEQLGLPHPPPTIEHVQACIGQPWQQFYQGLLPPEAKSHALAFHDAISARELDAIFGGRARLFDHTQDVLIELARRGYRLALISNASMHYFRAVIDTFELESHFRYIECLGDRDGYPKHRMLASAMDALGGTHSCMVGDKSGDFDAATHHGFPSVAMTHGSGSEQEFAMATVRAVGMRDLLDLLPRANA